MQTEEQKLPYQIKNQRLIGEYPMKLSLEFVFRLAYSYFKNSKNNNFLISSEVRNGSAQFLNCFIYNAKLFHKRIEKLTNTAQIIVENMLTRSSFEQAIMIGADSLAEPYQGFLILGKDGKPIDLNLVIQNIDNSIPIPQEIYDRDQICPQVNFDEQYLQVLAQQTDQKLIKHLKLVIDVGNGLAGVISTLLARLLPQLEIITLFPEPTAGYPHHLASIDNTDNCKILSKIVVESEADLGILFDAHAKNFLLLDEKGYIINNIDLKNFLINKNPSNPASDNPQISDLLFVLKELSILNLSASDLFASFVSNQQVVQKDLSMLEQKFRKLLNNLWISWNPHYILPIINMYGEGWRKNVPPSEFVAQYGSKRLHQIIEQSAWEIEENYRLFRQHKSRYTWFDKYCEIQQNQVFKKLFNEPIAYFCLEYGLIDWLQIYSGGLGILAGDYLKQTSDMGIPVVGLGIFYHQGYFHQDFSEDGWQLERYINQDPDDYPLELVLDKNGEQLTVAVEIQNHDVYVRAWRLNVGRTDLYLLDTNFNLNKDWEDKMICAHLYGGDEDTRIRQEILLGIGGARLLSALEIKPSIYHMNEGHSGFLVLELAMEFVKQGMTFDQAISQVDKKLVFTNHTLKQAGNDVFSYELIKKYFATYTDNLKTDIDSIYKLGVDTAASQDGFSMTTLGLSNAKITTAVSKLHGQAAAKLWPNYQLTPITNGVHMPTWVSPEIHNLLDQYLGENWHNCEIVDYQRIQSIPMDKLWQAHSIRKQKLINSLNLELGLQLDSDALTIAWSRRLAFYKRPDLITSDLDRLKQLVNNQDRPIQILISGKAHPRDVTGKEILQKINQALSVDDFFNKVVIIPGYNWQLARRMTSGADVWLNTPFRYEEASGTSGMKAAANGVLQLTTKDGWTDEVEWQEKGWVISEEDAAKSLHDLIEYKVAPLFYDRIVGSFNEKWVKMMLNAMQLVIYDYSSQRMLEEYLQHIYLPILNEKD